VPFCNSVVNKKKADDGSKTVIAGKAPSVQADRKSGNHLGDSATLSDSNHVEVKHLPEKRDKQALLRAMGTEAGFFS
jgi:hypothetical protein